MLTFASEDKQNKNKKENDLNLCRISEIKFGKNTPN